MVTPEGPIQTESVAEVFLNVTDLRVVLEPTRRTPTSVAVTWEVVIVVTPPDELACRSQRSWTTMRFRCPGERVLKQLASLNRVWTSQVAMAFYSIALTILQTRIEIMASIWSGV